MKSNKSVREAKGHNKGFEEAIVGVECYYLFLAFLYLDSVKHMNNVELSIELDYTELRERFLEEGEGVTVLDSDSIQCPVVDVKS